MAKRLTTGIEVSPEKAVCSPSDGARALSMWSNRGCIVMRKTTAGPDQPATVSLVSKFDKVIAHDHAVLSSGPVEHLLVATDFTECSNRAVARALERGNALGAQVTLLYVVEEVLPRKLMKRRQREARDLLMEYGRSLSPDFNNDISINVRTGEICQEIVREAIELGSDAIILGYRDYPYVGKKVASTVIDVVSYSDTPVLAVALPPDRPYSRAAIVIEPWDPSGLLTRAAQRFMPQTEAQLIRIAPPAAAKCGARHVDTFEAIGNSIEPRMDCVSQLGVDVFVFGSDRAFQHAHDDPSNLLRQATAQRCDLFFVRNR